MLFLVLSLLGHAHDHVDLPELPPGVISPCGTPDLWAPVAPEPMPAPGVGIDLFDRDPYNTPNVLRGERFALRYGNGSDVSQGELERLLDAFEASWSVEIDTMGHQTPYGTDEYYFNVYIGDTGNGAPPGRGAGGYYTSDRQGWPMIVVARNTLMNPEFADITAAHEFYHAVQGAADRYTYDQRRPGAWFWEASATWASSVVYPDNPNYAVFLFGYALYPHKRVDFFDYPDQGLVQEYYQYGAFIWPLHLADRTGSFEVIRDAWTDDGVDPDPLEVIRANLEAQGEDLDALWLDHAARNVTWDYPNRRVYLALVEQAAQRFPTEYNAVVAATLPNDGTDDWVPGPPSLAPERYGSNTLTMSRPQEGTYTFEIDGDLAGSLGDAAQYGAILVVEGFENAAPRYVPFTFEGTQGSVEVDDLDGAFRAHVVVGAWTDADVSPLETETFAYSYRVTYEPASEPDPDPVDPVDPIDPDEPVRAACGCSTPAAPAHAIGLLALLGLAGLARRR